MTGQRRALLALDRLIRIREIQSRQAMAAAGRVETRRQAEAALIDRVDRLIDRGPQPTGVVAAAALSARHAGDDILHELASQSRARLAETCAEQHRLAQALARARAAVDAAVVRRQAREEEL